VRAAGAGGPAPALRAGAALLVPATPAARRGAEERAGDPTRPRRAEALETAAREQRPRTGRGAADPGAGASARSRLRARTALLATAQDALRTDAAGRGEGRVQGLDCESFPRGSAPRPPVGDLSVERAQYQCVAVSSRFGEGDGEGVIGIPFRLVADFAGGRYAFCRVVPLSDRDRLTHPLPQACRT
jgi:hypothetical protein